MTHSICIPSMSAVPELGGLGIESSLPVLAQAAASVKIRRAHLEATLLFLGVTSVQAAREEYVIRCEAEVEDTVLNDQMKKLAPEGLAALVQKVTETRKEQMHLEAALAEATREQAEARHIEAEQQGLEELYAEVDKSRERARTAEQTFVKAQKVFEDHDPIKIELVRNRITKVVFAHLRRIERELHESETEVKRLQGCRRASSDSAIEGHRRA